MLHCIWCYSKHISLIETLNLGLFFFEELIFEQNNVTVFSALHARSMKILDQLNSVAMEHQISMLKF